jgi:hypothetical protein
MMDERRYGDEEVARIFETASSPQAPGRQTSASGSGLSLAELQAIGAEVGIEPERIAHAAAALEVRGHAAPRRTQLGVPVAVGQTVELPRAPTDREWELLLAELRETFGAHGKDVSRGELRAWRNGNLHAYVEPTESGQRLRLGTVKGDAVSIGWLGIGGLLAGLAMLVVALLFGEGSDGVETALLFAAMGIFALGLNALRLPRWAQEREEQMEYIATRARTLICPAPEPAASGDTG